MRKKAIYELIFNIGIVLSFIFASGSVYAGSNYNTTQTLDGGWITAVSVTGGIVGLPCGNVLHYGSGAYSGPLPPLNVSARFYGNGARYLSNLSGVNEIQASVSGFQQNSPNGDLGYAVSSTHVFYYYLGANGAEYPGGSVSAGSAANLGSGGPSPTNPLINNGG